MVVVDVDGVVLRRRGGGVMEAKIAAAYTGKALASETARHRRVYVTGKQVLAGIKTSGARLLPIAERYCGRSTSVTWVCGSSAVTYASAHENRIARSRTGLRRSWKDGRSLNDSGLPSSRGRMGYGWLLRPIAHGADHASLDADPRERRSP